MMRVGFLIAGFKGYLFFEAMQEKCDVAFASSYAVSGTLDQSYDQIQKLCRDNRYQFIDKVNFHSENIAQDVQLIFVVGWQYFFKSDDQRFIVIHDSLLPRLKGFCPIVTSLINGDEKIGCTAFKPNEAVDSGRICAQEKIAVTYPLKLKDAYLLLSQCFVKAANQVLKGLKNNNLTYKDQDNTLSTYSVWRNDSDYFIDWNWDSQKIQRFVHAVGWPFMGAKARYQNKDITIDEVDIIDDLVFENRQSGKIWSLNNGNPSILCGNGMLRVTSARYENGERVVFDHVRQRLDDPQNQQKAQIS